MLDPEESQKEDKQQKNQDKRVELSSESWKQEDLQQIQSMFSDFVDALNLSVEVGGSRNIRRSRGARAVIHKESDQSEENRLNLKKVKGEGRKGKKRGEEGRKGAKKKVNLEPIEENILKEDQINEEKVSNEKETRTDNENKTKTKEQKKKENKKVDSRDLDSKNQKSENKINGKVQYSATSIE